MTDIENKKLAVLIDADNAQAAICSELLAEIAKYGTASIKRAYGDWTTTNLKGWKNHLHKHAIQPIQQFSYTTGKNATDSSLIIDAMDLLHAGGLDGFCLISSDSDFTRLATRIREAGLTVYGFGEAKTPEPFRSACDKFVYTENLRPKVKKMQNDPSENTELKKMMVDAIKAQSKEDGWASLSEVGGFINKNNPSFDQRTYGFERLGELVRVLNYLTVEERKVGGEGSRTDIFISIKNARIKSQSILNK